jgi:LuxR family maltose regulon positive regulatory protein
VVDARLTPPGARHTTLDRSRLLARLDRGIARQVTVVTGPAGAGKSVLLATWAATRRPTAWVTLDEADRDPRCLWAHVLAALRRATGLPDLRLTGAGGGDATLVNAVASRLGDLPAPVILMLDNADRLGPGPAANSLAALLRHGVPTLRVVVGSRGRPPVPLEGLHLTGDCVVVGAEDLAFTASEAAELWESYGLPTSTDDMTALVERSEGLAAAVRLAAVHAAERTDRSPEEALGDFFHTEVFSREPPDVREFLLRTGVLDDPPPELARELTGRPDTDRLIERLRRDSDVLQSAVGDAARRLRYRRPFREFLRRQATLVLADELPEVHRRAARWYEHRGEALPAMYHATAAGDWSYAAALTVRLGAPQILGPGRAVVRDLQDRLPPDLAHRDPEIAATLALGKAEEGDAQAANGYATLIGRHLPRLPPEREVPLRAVLDLDTLMLARYRQDGAAVAAAAAALSSLLDGLTPDVVPADPQLRAIARESVGTALLWDGRFDEAGAHLDEALVAADRHGLDLVAADALGGLAFAAAVQGRLRRAAELARRADRLLDRDGWAQSHHATTTGLAQALVAWLTGRPDEARRRLEAATAWAPPARIAAATLAASVALSDGDAAEARRALDRAYRIEQDVPAPPLVHDLLAIAAAEVHLGEGHPSKALAAAADAGDPLSLAGVVTARAHLAADAPARAASVAEGVRRQPSAGVWARTAAWVTEALAADRLGHRATAAVAIGEAVAAAAPEDLVEPFRAGGAPLVSLVRRQPELRDVHPAFVGRLMSAAGARVSVGALLQAMTDRENAVMRYLPSLLTTEDIAAELSVSPNTVKTHLRGIYRKLAVNTRRDAVDRARELGLLRA